MFSVWQVYQNWNGGITTWRNFYFVGLPRKRSDFIARKQTELMIRVIFGHNDKSWCYSHVAKPMAMATNHEISIMLSMVGRVNLSHNYEAV